MLTRTSTALLLTGAALALQAALVCSTAAAQGVAPPARRVGTLVVAHGGGPEWNERVTAIAGQVNTGGPVEVSFLMGPGAKTARFQDAVRRLEARGADEIVVVPMLVSSHSGHYQQIRYLAGEPVRLDSAMHHHLHMAGIERADTRRPIRVARAMDDAPEIARVLADRALAAQPRPAGRALFVVGHGPNSAEDYAAWMANLRRVADSVKVMTGFRDVRVGLVRDDAPPPVRAEAVRHVRELIQLQHAATGQEVTVIPVLVSAGAVSRDKVRNDLAGLPVAYNAEPLLPHPSVARWVEARVREAARVAAAP